VSEEKHLKLIANGTPILIGLEPHGVLPLQMAAIADYYLFDGAIRTARDHECFKNEEERQRLRDAFAVSSAFASSSIFYVPLVRHLWPWLGLDPISRYHVKKVLSNGGVAIIVPGGVSEVLKMEKEREVVYLRKRYGFVKIAIQSGAALMPAYAFGATRTYSWWRLGPPLMTKKLAERISKILLFAPIVFWGRFFGPCPRRGRVVTVYGPPIEVKQTDEPTQEYVREVLDKFIEELEKEEGEEVDMTKKSLQNCLFLGEELSPFEDIDAKEKYDWPCAASAGEDTSGEEVKERDMYPVFTKMDFEEDGTLTIRRPQLVELQMFEVALNAISASLLNPDQNKIGIQMTSYAMKGEPTEVKAFIEARDGTDSGGVTAAENISEKVGKLDIA